MLLRSLRPGDHVRTQCGETGVVTRSADSDGRVAVRYSRRPPWQPPAEEGTKFSNLNGADELSIREDLLHFVHGDAA